MSTTRTLRILVLAVVVMGLLYVYCDVTKSRWSCVRWCVYDAPYPSGTVGLYGFGSTMNRAIRDFKKSQRKREARLRKAGYPAYGKLLVGKISDE